MDHEFAVLLQGADAEEASGLQESDGAVIDGGERGWPPCWLLEKTQTFLKRQKMLLKPHNSVWSAQCTVESTNQVQSRR